MPEESPIPVDVKNLEPLKVEIEEPDAPDAPAPVVTPDGGLSLPPETTEEADRVTAGQRFINLIWEFTQSALAIAVVVTTMLKAYSLASGQEIPTILSVGFGTVVGFYFGRTNHARQGGIGPKADEVYRGR